MGATGATGATARHTNRRSVQALRVPVLRAAALLFPLLGVLLGAALLATPALAGVGEYRCADPNKVYFGNARLFQKPCTIDSDRVYKHIPEYKEILDKGLTDKSPRYHFLMKKASGRFNEAVKQMARDVDHDLVAESGSVKKAKKGAKDVPDRTEDVIANIK